MDLVYQINTDFANTNIRPTLPHVPHMVDTPLQHICKWDEAAEMYVRNDKEG